MNLFLVPMKEKLENYTGEGDEEIVSSDIEDYVDEDFADYLIKRSEKQERSQWELSMMEGVTNVPDGIYVMDFEDFESKYGDLAPLKSLADDASIDMELLKQIRPGIIIKENLDRDVKNAGLQSLDPDY